MHTTTARTLAIVITTGLFAAVLTVVGQTSPAEAAAKYLHRSRGELVSHGGEGHRGQAAVDDHRRYLPVREVRRPVRSRQRPV